MSTGVQPGDGYLVNTLNGVSSFSVNKPYISDNNPGILVGVVLPEIVFPPFPDINGPPFPTFDDAFDQFIVETVIVGEQQYIRIASGAVNFTQSNMPLILTGAYTDTRQVWINKVAVRPGITATDGGEPGSPWMENGGYYSLPSSGEYYVTICKLDFDGAETTSSLLQENTPFVAIFSSTDALYAKIFQETGPSLYVNKHNVQKMTGYDAASTGFDGDFGNCHTTYFNPVKIGYSVKVIAIINTEVPVITAPQVEVLHAATATSNEVHRITLPPDMKKSGSFQLQFSQGITGNSDPTDLFNPLNSGNLTGQFQWNLANALKAIQSLRGNSSVTVSGENKLDITYINGLANTAVGVPAIINNSIGIPTTTYAVMQHVKGSIDMSIPISYNGSTLMNVEGLNEEYDPYYVNQADDWSGICNIGLKEELEGVTAATTDYYYDIVGPADWTSSQPSYLEEDGCIDEGCPHPFHVRKVVTGEVITFTVCTGMVNNIIPSNMDVSIGSGAGYVYISCSVSGENYPVDVTIGSGGSIPADTDSNSYIAIAQIVDENSEQLVSSSLWTERFKCGGDPAKYWWSNV
jgi:hypothetical protein